MDIYYMIVHLVPQKVYTVITNQDFKFLNIAFQDNLLLHLPKNLLAKWLSYNRLGTFIYDEMVPTFVPGITRPDIYCPVLESFPIFELAFQLHSHHIVNHFDFVQSCMLFRSQFTSMFFEHVKIENNTIDCIFKSKSTHF